MSDTVSFKDKNWQIFIFGDFEGGIFLALLLVSCLPLYCQLSNKGKNTKKQDQSIVNIVADWFSVDPLIFSLIYCFSSRF